jgi:hypothetical protein
LLEDHSLNRISAAAALAVIAALSAGCSGGAGSAGGAGVPSSLVPSGTTSAPVTSKMHTSDTLGGVGDGPSPMGMNVFLGDAPPAIGSMTASAINLGIDSVEVIENGTAYPIASYSTPLVVNVMANAGAPSSIGIGSVAPGIYSKLRFTVDVASSNVIDSSGNSHPIAFQTNAATQSSVGAGTTTVTHGNGTTIKMTVESNFLVDGNPATILQADFNAMESLSMGSGGNIVARPTLFAVPQALAGKADGTVVNQSGAPVSGAVVVLENRTVGVVNTTTTDANGNFDLHTVPAGDYHIWIYNKYTTASGQTLNASGNSDSSGDFKGPRVTIQAGATAQVGTIAD